MSQFSNLRDLLRSEGWEIGEIETTYSIRLTKDGVSVKGYGGTVTEAMLNANDATSEIPEGYSE